MKKILQILILLLIIPFLTHGQGFDLGGNDLDFTISPTQPGAYSDVFIRILSSNENLNELLITWTNNGVVVNRGVGEASLSLRTKGFGTENRISVSVFRRNGSVIQKSITIRPAEVTIILEADSYTPLFYKGRGVITHQAEIRAIAIPNIVLNGRKISPKNLYYEWRLNNKISLSDSGTGKDVFVFNGPFISRNSNLSVVARSLDKTIIARDFVSISYFNPEILVYEKNLLTGIDYSRAISGNILLQKEEFLFVVEPYFFPRSSVISDSLQYFWKAEGKTIVPAKERELAVRKEGIGSISLSIEILDPRRLLQTARKIFSVTTEESQI